MSQSTDAETFDPSPGKPPGLSRGFWLVVATLLLAGLAVALTLWAPYQQRQRATARLKSMGATVYSQAGGPDWLSNLLGRRLRTFDEVVFIEWKSGTANDQNLEAALQFPELVRLDLHGPAITDEGLARLARLKNLQWITLIHCPQVSEQAVASLQKEIPGLKVVRRGPALLGVAARPSHRGALITMVQPGSAADKAGLRAGDRILTFAGRTIVGFDDLAKWIGRHQPEETVEVVFIRGSRRRAVEVRLGRWN